MKTTFNKKLIATVTAFVLVISFIVALAVVGSASDSVTYVLDATADLPAMAQGAKADGDTEKAGTDGFFTIHYSAKTKIDGSSKNFEDGYSCSQRINMGGKTQVKETGIKNAIEFNIDSEAKLKIWWVCGDNGRAIDIFGEDGKILQTSDSAVTKNSLYITEFTLADAGKYYIGSSAGSNYYFKVEVTTGASEPEVPRADWAGVAAPAITGVGEGDDDNQVKVTATGLVGYDGADELIVDMYSQDGKLIDSKRSVAEKDAHTLIFEPANSGSYYFVASLVREGQDAKLSEASEAYTFSYPLGSSFIISATSKGNGRLEVVYSPVHEANEYMILVDGEVKETVSGTLAMVEGLTVGSRVSVTVIPLRGIEKGNESGAVSVLVTEAEQQTWGFTAYGPSTNLKNNGYIGSVNEDGKVTIFSEGGKGKIQPASMDGIAFYYTTVSSELNFTLRALVTVDSWTFSNGQEGFGLLATDRIGTPGDGSDFWNNSYLVGSTKIEYRYDGESDSLNELDKVYDHQDPAAIVYPKYTMKQGLGFISRTGITTENLPLFDSRDLDTINNVFKSVDGTFETTAGYYGMEAGTYNTIGNFTNNPEGTFEDRFLMTQFVLEIQKNNTGYFLSYYDLEGNLVYCQKFYDTEALSQLDSENVYVGFFASRNARATFSDIHFETVRPEDDKPAEERPITYVKPVISLSSPTVTTDLKYAIEVDTNVDGTVKISLNGNTIAEGVAVKGLVRFALDTELEYGENVLIITFTPDPNQDLGEYTRLETTENQSINVTVQANKGFYHNKTVFVSPTGLPNGNGTREYPLDIYSAVDNVVPGQTIVLMEGRYLLDKTVKIQRGMDGTADAPIKMIADPEAKSRPVLDFQGLVAGIVHGGDYWYFFGFDVTRSADMQKGFQVSGNYNTLDQINTYYNGNTGIQISRYTASDLYPDWPAYNLILNCTSYCNFDHGFEDADGFAAKLTVGDGNVFDGCIAFNNADDGWDLYAKVETGSIGVVTIQNCVAFANGYLPEYEGKVGNGNGFKLGGSSLPGKHRLINCVAFYNYSKGIDSNSGPDIYVENCTSYNNGSYNCAFYTNAGANTEFVAKGIISFKDGDLINHLPKGTLEIDEQLKGKGTQVNSAYINDTTYYWYSTECRNASGAVLDASIFKSLVFTEITRNADGTINMNGFLELTDKAPANAGARMAGQASADNSTLPEGDDHIFSDKWVTTDPYNHWHVCECGFMTEIGEHEYEYVMEVEPTPTTSGWKYKQCKICGKKGSRIEVYYDELVPGTPDVPGGDAPIDPAPQLNFFQRIWFAIVSFFKRLFGLA